MSMLVLLSMEVLYNLPFSFGKGEDHLYYCQKILNLRKRVSISSLDFTNVAVLLLFVVWDFFVLTVSFFPIKHNTQIKNINQM